MVERNTIVGIGFLLAGFTVSSLGYFVVRNVTFSSLGLAIAIIGGSVLLVAPESESAYKVLFEDAIRNIESILEESALHEKAYFFQVKDGEIRAFIPDSKPDMEYLARVISSEAMKGGKVAGFLDYDGTRGLLLIPPGAQIAKLARGGQTDSDLEEELNSVLVEYSHLASSVIALEARPNILSLQINKPKVKSDSTFFNNCLGTPVSCVASSVATMVMDKPVRIVDEKFGKGFVRLTLEIIHYG